MRFPLILRRNENDSKKYFVTEADSLELLSRSEEESRPKENTEPLESV
jgi:hypothetical protein